MFVVVVAGIVVVGGWLVGWVGGWVGWLVGWLVDSCLSCFVGCCWLLVVVVGCCWLLLVVGCWFLVLGSLL